ncbi:MAG: hypothetical protein KC609_07620 [Myxococcales bacterium]|nr:hypothetical protein [Myxococcales bacterium]
MKAVLIASLLVVTVLWADSARARRPEPYLRKHGFIPVPLGASAVSFGVVYPGPRLSGICGIELRASAPFRLQEHYTLLALQLVVSDSTGRKVLTAQGPNLTYTLASHGTYLTSVTIRMKSKGTIRDAIRKAMRGSKEAEQVQLIALPVLCKK